MSRRARRVHLGLAVGPERVVAVQLRHTVRGVRPGRVRVRELAPPDEERGWPGLTAALLELRRELRAGGGRVEIALLRPFGHAKVLRLPPVRGRELGALVARNARRYFLVGADSTLTGVRRIPARASGAERLALAGCAPDPMVERVAAAVARAGFRIGGITPASAALLEAVRTLVPRTRRGRTAVVVESPGWAELLLLEKGEPREIRPRSAAPEAASDRAVSTASADGLAPDRVVTCGSHDEAARDGDEDGATRGRLRGSEAPRGAARRKYDAAGRRSNRLKGPGKGPARIALPDAAALAAYGAVLLARSAPQLLPARLEAELGRRAGWRSVRLAAVAAGLLVAAGGLHLRGLEGELAAVEARRRALSEPVAEAFTAKRSVEGVRARLEAIGRADAGRRDWIGLFAELARALPDSAHLVSLAADGDRLRLEGIAASASRVVPALEASPWFLEVALAAPVRLDGRGAGERFTIALGLEEAVAPARVRPATAGTPRENGMPPRTGGGRLTRRETP